MRALLALLLLAGCSHAFHPRQHAQRFAMRVVAEGMAGPWEIFVGPDQWLWITERAGKRITRIEPRSGRREVLLTLDDTVAWGQNGVLGAAYDAGALFVAYTYLEAPEVHRTKIVRYAYDGKLSAPHTLIHGLAADGDHASGRLQVGPDGRVYYTVGDQGANQFDGKCKPNRAQRLPTADELARGDWSSYQGKVLRLERDGAIPADNPLLAGVRSHVYSYGHRNVQGLAFDDTGRLYVAEHGPKTDDEINEILPGKNYGWPHVAGFRDDQGYEYGNWSAAPNCAQLAYDDYVIPAEVPRQPEHAWDHPDFMPPLRTLYSVASDFPFASQACAQPVPNCWPTVAPSSLEFYTPGATGFASWGRALLVTSLKQGSVLVLPLDERGVPREPARALFATDNRYRDLAVAPDKRTIYVVTDDYGFSSGPTQKARQKLLHLGALLEFTPVE